MSDERVAQILDLLKQFRRWNGGWQEWQILIIEYDRLMKEIGNNDV